jgi:hypothetical protein
MPQKYRVQLHLTGSAIVEIDADSVDAAKRAAVKLELADIARVGFADILAFEVAVREITQAGPVTPHEDETDAAGKPRPSGWYRPG